ncbi:MAG: hypothetical protein Q7V14_01860 [Coriobacteriia bacterium]|nr:hypothetical protein [Coriobacteriia bacterium]
MHAVTTGVGVPTPSKDSGADWLGDVPAHWQVVRARYLLSNRDDRSADGSEELLTVSHITGVTARSAKTVNMFMAETNEGYKKCVAGDLVVNTMWAFAGAAGVAPFDGLVSPSYNVYRFTTDVVCPHMVDKLSPCGHSIAYGS